MSDGHGRGRIAPSIDAPAHSTEIQPRPPSSPPRKVPATVNRRPRTNASSHSKSTTTTRFPVGGHRQPRWLFLLYAFGNLLYLEVHKSFPEDLAYEFVKFYAYSGAK